MVSKFFKLIGQEIHGLHETAYLLASFTLLSQILGLVRDRFLASSFGASAALDSYYAAFRVPDLIFVSIASIVSISVLVPFLVERFEIGGAEARRFLDAIFSFFSLLMVSVAVLAFIAAPYLMRWLFPAIAAGPYGVDLLVMTRIMLISPVLLGLSNLLASVAQAKHRFFAYALSPVFYNLGIIIGVVIFYREFGMIGLAVGVAFGALLHLLCQVLASKDVLPRPRFPLEYGLIKNVVALSFSRTLALSASQIATLVLVIIASGLAAGSISIFNFSWNLQSTPLAIIGVSYTVALFPTISRLFSRGQSEKFAAEMTAAARHITFWSVPVIILFIVLRAQIVRTILGSGNFDWNDTRLVAAALALFAVSLLAQSLVLLFVRGYYAGGNTKKPLLVNLVSAALVIVFSFGFLKLFGSWHFFRYFVESLLRVSDIAGAEVLMLPLGFSVATILNAGIFWFYFGRRFKAFSPRVIKTFFETFSASVIMGFVAYKMLDIFDDIFNINTVVGIFLQGLLSGLVGIVVLVVVLKALQSEELKEIWVTLHHKIWKAKVIVPEQESL